MTTETGSEPRQKTLTEIWEVLKLLSDGELITMAKAHHIHQRTFLFVKVRIGAPPEELYEVADKFAIATGICMDEMQVVPAILTRSLHHTEGATRNYEEVKTSWNLIGFYKPSWDLSIQSEKEHLMRLIQEGERNGGRSYSGHWQTTEKEHPLTQLKTIFPNRVHFPLDRPV